MTGLAVSRDAVRVRRWWKTRVVPWREVDHFAIGPAPSLMGREWQVLRVHWNSSGSTPVVKIKCPRPGRFDGADAVNKSIWGSVEPLAEQLNALRYDLGTPPAREA